MFRLTTRDRPGLATEPRAIRVHAAYLAAALLAVREASTTEVERTLPAIWKCSHLEFCGDGTRRTAGCSVRIPPERPGAPLVTEIRHAGGSHHRTPISHSFSTPGPVTRLTDPRLGMRAVYISERLAEPTNVSEAGWL